MEYQKVEMIGIDFDIEFEARRVPSQKNFAWRGSATITLKNTSGIDNRYVSKKHIDFKIVTTETEKSFEYTIGVFFGEHCRNPIIADNLAKRLIVQSTFEIVPTIHKTNSWY